MCNSKMLQNVCISLSHILHPRLNNCKHASEIAGKRFKTNPDIPVPSHQPIISTVSLFSLLHGLLEAISLVDSLPL